MSERYISQSAQDPTIFDNRNSYSEVWIVPEQVQEAAEVVAPALLLDREEYNRLWAEQKKERRRHNESLRHNIFDHGTFYINGVGQKRG